MNTLIYFNDHLYGLEKTKLEKTANRLNDCVKLITKTTEGKVSKLDYKAFCNYLNTQTGFKNAKMSADALDLADVYSEVKAVSDATGMGSYETGKVELGMTDRYDLTATGSTWFKTSSVATMGGSKAFPGGSYTAIVKAECIAQ